MQLHGKNKIWQVREKIPEWNYRKDV